MARIVKTSQMKMDMYHKKVCNKLTTPICPLCAFHRDHARYVCFNLAVNPVNTIIQKSSNTQIMNILVLTNHRFIE